jgi:hypothetical protein
MGQFEAYSGIAQATSKLIRMSLHSLGSGLLLHKYVVVVSVAVMVIVAEVMVVAEDVTEDAVVVVTVEVVVHVWLHRTGHSATTASLVNLCSHSAVLKRLQLSGSATPLQRPTPSSML